MIELCFTGMSMNSSTCQVDQIRIRYREVGLVLIQIRQWGLLEVDVTLQILLNLTPSTQYEYDFKIWYCDGTVMNRYNNGTFTYT